MQSYSIWNDVQACHYKSSKSYGNKETGVVKVSVGSSSKNSYLLIKHVVSKRKKGTFEINGDKYEDVFVFKFGVEFQNNGHIITLACKIFKNNKNRAGELLATYEFEGNGI